MHLFLIRHGQSQHNAMPHLSYHVADPALTELGQQQVQALAQFVAAHPEQFGFTQLYASPMLRALQTAAPLTSALGLRVSVWPDICEYGGVMLDEEGNPHGIPQPGLSRRQISEQFPAADLDERITDEGWWTITSGYEPFEHVMMRVVRVLGILRQRAGSEERVALVSHGLFIDLLLKALLNQLPLSTERVYYLQHNTAVNYLHLEAQRNGHYTEVLVEYLNSRAHLPRELWTG